MKWTEIFISVGKEHGMNPSNLKGLVFDEATNDLIQVRRVSVQDNYSIFEVETKNSDQIVEDMQGLFWENTPIIVRLSKKEEKIKLENPNIMGQVPTDVKDRSSPSEISKNSPNIIGKIELPTRSNRIGEVDASQSVKVTEKVSLNGPKIIGKVELPKKRKDNAEGTLLRLPVVANEFNTSVNTIVDFLNDSGYDVSMRSKVTEEMYHKLEAAFFKDAALKEEAGKIIFEQTTREDVIIESPVKTGRIGENDQDGILIKTPGFQDLQDETTRLEELSIKIDNSGIEPVRFEKIESLLKHKKQIILQGAPGTGKSFFSDLLALKLTKNNPANLCVVQFHQSYSYEEFIEGLRFNDQGLLFPNDGIFKKFCETARQRPNENFVFVIDEINRGNISKIFGELLYLLENRGKYIVLSYSQKAFSIPNNLFIIGTMNTADRSLALVDFAMRRRFRFVTLEPDYEVLKYKLATNESIIPIVELVENIREVNKQIRSYPSLGKPFEMGISYFIKDEKLSFEGLQDIWEYEIYPLFEEYFFEDHSKIEQLRKILFKSLS